MIASDIYVLIYLYVICNYSIEMYVLYKLVEPLNALKCPEQRTLNLFILRLYVT